MHFSHSLHPADYIITKEKTDHYILKKYVIFNMCQFRLLNLNMNNVILCTTLTLKTDCLHGSTNIIIIIISTYS